MSFSSSATNPERLHVALFPWLAFGHMIPFLEVAKHIARRGHKVSFISTPRNIQRLPKIPQTLTPLISLVQIPLARVDSLPEDAEATMDVPINLIPFLKIAYDELEHGIHEFLQAQTPDWIIYDFAPHWLPSIAIKLGIKRAMLSTFNASTICFMGSTSPEVNSLYAPRTKPEEYTVPPAWIPFPTKLCFKPFEAKRMLGHTNLISTPNASGVTDWSRMESTYQGCQVFFFRSCKEIEGEWIELLQTLYKKHIVPTGFLPPLTSDDQDMHENSWSRISDWLNKYEKRNVVYVAFGSEVTLSQDELNEVALGLELSGLPFIWVLRKPRHESHDVMVKLPEGFEDRTKERGLVWDTWAPQRRILSHKSVGGFLSHCGWSSLIEGLQHGRPLIMLPIMYDQGLIARLWDKKVGVEVERDEESGWFSRQEVAKAVKLVVMDEEGKLYRDGAKEYSEIFKNKELHDRYMDECVEYLENHGLEEIMVLV